MSRQQSIIADIEELNALKVVAGALTEISAKKINTLRTSFTEGSAFYDDMRILYALVKTSARKRGAESTPRPEELKTLLVGLTSNQHFYGALNQDVIESLTTDHVDEDVVIIGRTGRSLVERMGRLRGRNVRMVLFQHDVPQTREVNLLLHIFGTYDRVLFYYPRYISVFEQHVEKLDIAELPATEGDGQ